MVNTHRQISTLLIFILSCWVLQACYFDNSEDNYSEPTSRFQPIYMTLDELRSSVTTTSPQALVSPGKIYTKDNWLFVNERGKGIHMIDNTNPSSPKKVVFIAVPGNIDLAVKGDILYADNVIDLVAISIADVNNIHVVGRSENVFPNIHLYSPDGFYVENDDEKGVIVGWKE